MKERLVFFPFTFDGTASASGSAVYVTTQPLTFYAGGVYAANSTGGSVKITYAGTAQGTAVIKTESAAGSCYIGTVATGWGANAPNLVAGTSALQIPAGGTIVVQGTAAAAGFLCGYAAFMVDEFGGTAYP
jgi:hypothetical protein